MHNDLAVLQLERLLDKRFSNEICLPKKADVLPVDSEVTAIGFGREKESSKRTSDVLRWIKLRLVPQTSLTCRNEMTDPETQLCAGLEMSGRGQWAICFDTILPPLWLYNKQIHVEVIAVERWCTFYPPIKHRFELVGIVSFGAGCGLENHAGAYTRFSSYLDWI